MNFTPLFPAFKEFKEYGSREKNKTTYFSADYPQVKDFVTKKEGIANGAITDYEHACWYLHRLGLNSEATYGKLRTEIERFLLWSWEVKEKSVAFLSKTDINEYIEFCYKPPKILIGTSNKPRFKVVGGINVTNVEWKPFVSRPSMSDELDENGKLVKKKKKQVYKLEQKSIKEIFSNLSMFYGYLIDEGYANANFIAGVSKNCRFLVKGKTIGKVKHFSEDDWKILLNFLIEKANEDDSWETILFVVVSMKTLYLRVSELSIRDDWTPMMNHFKTDESGERWWFTAYGKGRKIRDISVPDAYIPFLERYRLYRGLTPLPFENENEQLLEQSKNSKYKENNGYSNARLREIIYDAFEKASDEFEKLGEFKSAMIIKNASSHYLRHTGASHDAENRPTRDLSEDLGHSSVKTTEEIYIHADLKKRHASGRLRKV